MIACGTTRRMNIKNKQPNASSPSVETPKITSQENDALKAKKIRAISNLELSSLQLIEKGTASWYGTTFHGQLTASGEPYNMYALTAAHRTLPFNTIVLVKNMDNGQTAIVRINDRGPYASNRIIDVSKKAARKLGLIETGTAHVQLYTLNGALSEANIENIKVPTFTIQLASYQDEESAFSFASRVRGSRVEIAFVDGDKIFRVYYGLYRKKENAHKALQNLTLRRIEGYVKQVENG